MLLTVNKLKNLYTEYDFSNYSDERLEMKLNSLENAMREYTHNHFYNRRFKTVATAKENTLIGDFTYFKEGDTIELYDCINEGLYVIESLEANTATLNKDIYECKEAKIIKIQYPADILDGVAQLINYDLNVKDTTKQNIASESISRHSVSYVTSNSSNTLLNYPSYLLSFLSPYMRWRT